MENIRIRLAAFATVTALLCSCSSTKNSDSSDISDTNTTSQSTSAESFGTAPAMSESSQAEQTSSAASETEASKQIAFIINNKYSAADKNEITSADAETMKELCSLVCEKWYEGCKTKETPDFKRLMKYSRLIDYMCLAAAKVTCEAFPDAYSGCLDVTSTELNGKTAKLSGVYRDKNGAYGSWTFIVENIYGKLCVNDVIFNAIDSQDILCRADFIASPVPDYWQSEDNYKAAETILNSLQ